MGTKIEWTNETWNPIIGCSKISEGCENCYAEKMAFRLMHMPHTDYYQYVLIDNGEDNPDEFCNVPKWNGLTHFVKPALGKPLKWKKPRRIFVCSMGDLFHESVPFEWIDKVFSITQKCRQHTFQILTKRPDRMKEYFISNALSFRIAKQIDMLNSKINESLFAYELKPIDQYPGYYIDTNGKVYSELGSSKCVNCGKDISTFAKSKYCSKKCKSRAEYIFKKDGKYPINPKLNEMKFDIGEQGHCSVMVYRDTKPIRLLVHRIVLSTFNRLPKEKEQCRHLDGNPLNNHIANLKWGTQSDNWDDRKRHGNGQPNKSTKTSIKEPVTIPFKNVMVGVTAENQEQANKRIPILLEIPAVKHFVSLEPLLSDIDLNFNCQFIHPDNEGYGVEAIKGLDWVIAGPETGPKARPMQKEWIENLYNQCKAANVPFFDKKNTLELDLTQIPES